MNIVDSILGAEKWVMGTGLRALLILFGLMLGGVSYGHWLTMIVAGISIVLGLGLVAWREKNRIRSVGVKH